MKKQWIIPDIHGYAKTLKELIEQQIRPSKEDRLFFLGDYIDRGPDSKGVIDYIMNMEQEGLNIRLLLGNHEDLFLEAYKAEFNRKRLLGVKSINRIVKDWERYGGKETMKSFGIKNIKKIPAKYIEWIENMEHYIELEKHILVHAGFNFNLEDPFSDKRAMLWVRDYKVKPEKINNKTIIHGHVPVSLEFINMTVNTKSYHFIDLDNGLYMDGGLGFGNLCSYELNSRQLIIQPNMD